MSSSTPAEPRLAHIIHIVAACVLLAGTPLVAQEAPESRQQRVLALYPTTPGAAGAAVFETVHQREFRKALGTELDFHSEYIDFARFSDGAYIDALVTFLRYKYTQLPPDVIIAATEAAQSFVEKFRGDLFPDAPVVFINRAATVTRPPGMTGIHAPLDLAGTIDLALALHPATTQVFVISGISEFDRLYQPLARQQFQRFAPRISMTYLTGLPMADLERTVASLPPESVIFFLSLAEDGAGARFRSTEALDQVAAVANRPIYAWNAIGMDHGIVGGRMFTNEIVAQKSTELALEILAGKLPDTIPIATVDPHRIQLDWRQLRRWNVSDANVPAGATILYREPTLWDRYKFYISGAVLLIVLQAGLIAGLFVQLERRRRAETEMRSNQQMLQASHQQISELFGRLIAAQESERSRIARDLHDDVSQRIAALSITMSGLKHKLVKAEAADPVGVLGAMQRDVIALAEGIRQVSHNLHPSVLQHSGLVPALREFCAQFAKQHGIAVVFNANGSLPPIDNDAALALYRVTQEALHNIAKHAGARSVDVALTKTSDGVRLAISDDGRGFDLIGARQRATGLGLVSIDERLRALQGHVEIATHPGGGTRVNASIPLRTVAAEEG